MIVLETARQSLRWLTLDDAPFIFELLNDPAWLRFIGDRGVRTLEDARKYILRGPLAMIECLGFGRFLVERKSDDVPMGLCGLIKRDGLDDIDIGFANRAHDCCKLNIRRGFSCPFARRVPWTLESSHKIPGK